MNEKGGYQILDLKSSTLMKDLRKAVVGKPVLVYLEDGSAEYMILTGSENEFILYGNNKSIEIEYDEDEDEILTMFRNGIYSDRIINNRGDAMLSKLVNLGQVGGINLTINVGLLTCDSLNYYLHFEGYFSTSTTISVGSNIVKNDNNVPNYVWASMYPIQSTNIYALGNMTLLDSVTNEVTNVPVAVIKSTDKLYIQVLDDVTITNKTYVYFSTIMYYNS